MRLLGMTKGSDHWNRLMETLRARPTYERISQTGPEKISPWDLSLREAEPKVLDPAARLRLGYPTEQGETPSPHRDASNPSRRPRLSTS